MTALAIPERGIDVATNDEGFLTNPDDWTQEIAVAIAAAHNIELGDDHWKVIEYCRSDFAAAGKSPGLRRITKKGGIPTKLLYSLFPGGPGKLSAKIAGLPKPTGCV